MKRLKRLYQFKLARMRDSYFRVSPRKGALWLIIILYCSILIYLFFGPLLRTTTFLCKTNSIEDCPDYVVPELAKTKNELIYLIQKDDLETKLSSSLPRAKDVTVFVRWPNILGATITWQDAMANLSIPASSSALLVDEAGQIMRSLTEPDPTLPTIIASSAADLIISEHITETSLVSAIKLVSDLKKYNIKVSTINVLSPNEIWANLENGRKVIFTSSKPINDQVHTLQLIMSQTTMNQNQEIVDVRLDRPVIKPIQ